MSAYAMMLRDDVVDDDWLELRRLKLKSSESTKTYFFKNLSKLI